MLHHNAVFILVHKVLLDPSDIGAVLDLWMHSNLFFYLPGVASTTLYCSHLDELHGKLFSRWSVLYQDDLAWATVAELPNVVVLIELASEALRVEEQAQDGFLVSFLLEVKKTRLIANIHLDWEVYDRFRGAYLRCVAWFGHFHGSRQAQVAGVQWLVLWREARRDSIWDVWGAWRTLHS